VVTVHGIPFVERERLSRGTWHDNYAVRQARSMTASVLREAAGVISTTAYDRRILKSYIRGMVFEIPNPVADTFFTDGVGRAGALCSKCGVLVPRKNIAGLLRSYMKMEGRTAARLRIIGRSRTTITGSRSRGCLRQ